MGSEIATVSDSSVVERVLIQGDLSRLSSSERTQYYMRVCESVGLNPLTKPFEYLRLNGKEQLYALRSCTDQLRQIHGVSIRITGREEVGDTYIVTAQATDRTGRTDESIGAVALKGLTGEALSNALMKCETKAKRRVTLSICGLGMLDETETEIDSVSDRIAPGLTDDQQATAATQAKVRSQDEDFADELIAMLPTLLTEDVFFAWIHHHGWEVHRMVSNPKQRLWRAMNKHLEATGMKIPAADIKLAFSSAPAPSDSNEEGTP